MCACRAVLALSIYALLAACCSFFAEASIYQIQSKLWIPPFQHAEKMFASDKGPILSRAGNSTIKLRVDGVNLTSEMNDWRLVVFFYHVTSLDSFELVEEQMELLACSPLANKDGATTLSVDGTALAKRFVFPVQNESVHVEAEYKVDQSGWTDTQIFVCSDANGATEVMPFVGTMEILNPFGLLPAVLYGMLPFSALLSIGYVLLDVFFAVLLIKHRKQTLSLHFGIQTVVILGTAASSAWFYAFYRMNKTGEPVCCPYPTTFLVAVILDTLMRTFARLLLIVVCLGYGIVRDHLRRTEVALITFLSLAYFVSGIADEITRGTSSGAEFREKPTSWSFVQLLCNLLFIMWIHFALEKTIKQLAQWKQTAKLAMYKSLAWCLAGFVVFFSLLTLVAVCGRMGVFDWDVEWEWMQLVAWPVLNFIVSASLCMIWRPTKNSSQFAFSMQLPMEDEKDPEAGHSDGMEMIRQNDDDSEDEDEDLFSGAVTFDDEEEEEVEEVEMEVSPAKKDVQAHKKNKQQAATIVTITKTTKAPRDGKHEDDEDEEDGL